MTFVLRLTFVFSVIFLIAVSASSYNNSISNLNSKIQENSIPKPDSSKIVVQNNSIYENSEYVSYKESLEEIVNNKNPKEALKQLNSDIYTSKIVQENCHSLTHAVGDFALKKYNNDTSEAIKYNLDICGGGYIHGIIEQYLVLRPNSTAEMLKLCSETAEDACFHALGYGFMLMHKFNVDRAVQDCKKLNQKNAELRCGEGVFMENFDSENASDKSKPFVKPSDPFYLCPNYEIPYNATCFYYSGRYIFKHNGNAEESLQKCIEAGEFADSCIKGMAAGIIRSDLFHPEKMEIPCNSVPNFKQVCYDGAVNYHIFILSDPKQTRAKMCEKLQNQENQQMCLKSIDNSPFLMK